MTFFFRNFPDHCSVVELEKRFSKAGNVEDIYIPTKRDKIGNNFGFVRFLTGGGGEELLRRLNQIWLGSYKLRVYYPRFDRQPERRGREGEKKAAKEGLGRFTRTVPATGKRIEGFSYSEALGRKNRIEAREEKDKKAGGSMISPCFQSTEE